MKKSMHYWRIHARVARRLWSDISQGLRDTIANDPLQLTEASKWFATKVDVDATRLYEDVSYYDNAKETFGWDVRYDYEDFRLAA